MTSSPETMSSGTESSAAASQESADDGDVRVEEIEIQHTHLFGTVVVLDRHLRVGALTRTPVTAALTSGVIHRRAAG